MGQPGILAKIVALVGILSFIVADFFSIIFFQTILTEPLTWEEGLGQIVVIVFSLAYIIIFGGLGALLVLLGKIHNQIKSLVIISTLALLPIVATFAYVTIVTFSTDSLITYIGIWLVIGLLLVQHLRGLQPS